MYRVLVAIGTRPEAIKMCPVIIEMKKYKDLDCVVCLTGQHREMLAQAMDSFGITEDYNLDVMTENQSLTMLNAQIMMKIDEIFDEVFPSFVLVHGDTSSSYAVALAAFYKKIPIAHVEAGLRTGNMYSPFPEEMNRVLTDRLSTLLFAPTDKNRLNLKQEGITDNVYVTGNTVIDSFAYTTSNKYIFNEKKLRNLGQNRKIILVTAHRRENIGKPLNNICNALIKLSIKYRNIIIVYPVHMNPGVRSIVYKKLSGINNILLLEPINVTDMHNLLKRCYMVMTDSGGIQEEAPYFDKPVLVLRTETERTEAIEAGTVRITGVNTNEIVAAAELLINESSEYIKMAKAVNPYGDGNSSVRIVNILRKHLEEI